MNLMKLNYLYKRKIFSLSMNIFLFPFVCVSTFMCRVFSFSLYGVESGFPKEIIVSMIIYKST
jgi:hypothetical protein